MSLTIAYRATSSARIFPPLTANPYEAPVDQDDLDADEKAARLLLSLSRGLSRRQRLGWRLRPAEAVARLLYLHRSALGAELAGHSGRADFWWREVEDQWQRLSDGHPGWAAVAARLAQQTGTTVLGDPVSLRQRLVREILLDAHLAFFNGKASGAIARHSIVRALLHCDRAWKLLPEAALPADQEQALRKQGERTKVAQRFRLAVADQEQALRGQVGKQDVKADLEVSFLTAVFGGTVTLPISSHIIEMKVPAGTEDGKQMRLSGQGPGSSDLIVKLRVQPHAYFRREGNDIFLEVPLTVREAVLGMRVDVPTLRGDTLTVTVKPGMSEGTRLRLPGYGIDGGHQYLTFKIIDRSMARRDWGETPARGDSGQPGFQEQGAGLDESDRYVTLLESPSHSSSRIPDLPLEFWFFSRRELWLKVGAVVGVFLLTVAITQYALYGLRLRARNAAFAQLKDAVAHLDEEAATSAAQRFLALVNTDRDARADSVRTIRKEFAGWPARRQRDTIYRELLAARAKADDLAVLLAAERFLAVPLDREDRLAKLVRGWYAESFARWFVALGGDLDTDANLRIKRYNDFRRLLSDSKRSSP